jgi:hypothetical protein
MLELAQGGAVAGPAGQQVRHAGYHALVSCLKQSVDVHYVAPIIGHGAACACMKVLAHTCKYAQVELAVCHFMGRVALQLTVPAAI